MNKRSVCALGMAFVLAGCSAGGSGSGKEQTLTVGLFTEMNGDFSPMYYQTVNDHNVVNLVYQGLLAYDKDANLVPELAEELPTISDDGTTMTFKLKKGVKFSDGSKFTSKDVKATFSVMADPSYTGRFSSNVDFLNGYSEYHDGDAKDVSGIETPDDYTVVFHMSKPKIDAESTLGTQKICSVKTLKYKKGKTSNVEKNNSNPIGTGPYKLKSFSKTEGASLDRNENFEAKDGEYQISKIMIKKTETSTEIKELENGTVDYIPDVVDANKINTVAKDKDKGLTMDSYPSDREDFLFMNTAAGACQDQAVRQALAYGFDREAYIESYYKLDDKDAKLAYVPGLFGNPVSGENSAYVRGEEKADGATYYDYDVEKAKQILDDAGWTVGSDGIREKDGQKLSIKFLAAKEKDAMDTMIPMLQKQWGELGVDFKANTVEFNTVISTVGDDSAVGDWDVSYLGNSFTSPEDTGVDYFIQSQGVNNFARLKDDELDSYLAAGAYTADKDASAAAYLKAYVRQAELCAYLPTDGVQTYCLRNKKVKGLNTSSTFIWSQSMATAYIDD